MTEVTVMNSLALAEREELAQHEAVIERGIRYFLEVGQALLAIQTRDLYRETHGTFADYLKERWRLSTTRAYELINAAQAHENLSAIADGALPENEAQYRPLTKLKDPAEQAEAWELAKQTAPESGMTAAHVAAAVEVVQETDDEADRVAALFGRTATVAQPEAKKPPRNHDLWFTRHDHKDRVVAVLGKIELDPASCEEANAIIGAERYFTKEQDGLLQHWEAETVFCNPPYSLAGDFVARLVDAYQEGHIKQAILLVNANTSSAWFDPLWDHTICFVKGRVSFIAGDGGDSQTGWSPSVFVYLGHDPLRFYENFHDLGAIVARMEKPIW